MQSALVELKKLLLSGELGIFGQLAERDKRTIVDAPMRADAG